MKTLISIIGTTGIGKTKLSIGLANAFDTEIVSCDSRQFYHEMKIGTAAPTPEELSKAPHHFIGQLSVEDDYSIGQYELDALAKVEELFQEKDQLILVGGSMMYEKALIEGLHDLPPANEANQQLLNTIWKEEGIEKLQDLLKTLDPVYYSNVDLDNPRRLFRSIDLIWQTNTPYSSLISAPKPKRNFNVIRIGIKADRELIYDRINRRVDAMMENGLLQEVETLNELRNKHKEKPLVALQTVGYTELFKYLDGKWSLDFAVEEIKKNSRRFAKRQLTWYRKEEDINWVSVDNTLEESLSLLDNTLTNN